MLFFFFEPEGCLGSIVTLPLYTPVHSVARYVAILLFFLFRNNVWHAALSMQIDIRWTATCEFVAWLKSNRHGGSPAMYCVFDCFNENDPPWDDGTRG